MTGTPNTIAVILLFFVIFFTCILWATRGHAEHDHSGEDITAKPGKTS
jgi:uncharacterized membrane protein